jgi:peptide-methionine (R)-S-oxide reductase
MKKSTLFSALLLTVAALAAAIGPGYVSSQSSAAHSTAQIKIYSVEKADYVLSNEVIKSQDDWKRALTAQQFHVLREKGTEKAFTGKYATSHEHGTYRCAGCGLDLFRSEAKYDSGTGWPSFTAPIAKENIRTAVDKSFFSSRIEVQCRRCGGHIGHVFEDGPPPAGLRYCLNSAALQLTAAR